MAQLLQNAVYGGAMIAAVAVLRRVLKGRLAPGARLALWAVCLFRLLTPAAPESVLSLWRLFGREAQTVSLPAPEPTMPPVGWTGAFVPAVPVVTAPGSPAPAPAAGVPWGTVLAAVWVAVAAVLAARYVLAYVRTRRAVGRAVPVGRDDPRYGTLPRYARLREGLVDGAPLTFGAVRPTVVLTPGLAGAALECVLAHEAVHARRRDNLWHYAMAAALVLHWWNPAVWLMARLLRRDVELACDRAAVKKLGAGRRAEYANTLVSLATKAEGPAFCQTFGRKAAEERIIAVMKYRKMTVIGAALTLALVLAVTVGFASNPAERLPDEESTTSSGPAPLLYMFSLSPEGELLKINISLDCLRDSLAEHVENGSMTQAQANVVLEQAETLSQDGVTLEWTFTGASGLFTHRGDDSRKGFDVYYLNADGDEVPVDPADVVERFILPDSIVKALLQYVDGVEPTPVVQPTESGLVPAIGTKGEEGYIRESDTPGANVKNPEEALAYMEWLKTQPSEILIPLYDAQGNVIGQFAVSNPTGQENAYVEYDGRMYNRADLSPETLEWLDWYLALPEEEQMAVSYVPWELRDPGSYPSAPAGDEIPGFVPDYDPNVEDSAGTFGEPICNLPTAPTTNCGVEGCTETWMHQHQGDRCIVLGMICPVEGCTIPVCHDHDGVTYYCNGAAHSGGVCDGSCRGWSLTAWNEADTTPTAAPVSNGHHSDSHHGNGYHGGHH